MFKYFDQAFFRFLLGFIGVIAVSLLVFMVVAQIDERKAKAEVCCAHDAK